MNPEHWHYIIMGISGMLFAAGGTEISQKVGGQKWLRRILLPVLLALCLKFALDVEIWRCVAFFVASFGVLTLGYGDNAPWFSFKKFFHGFVFPFKSGYPKVFTACMIPLPTLFIGFSLWIFTYPLIFLGVFALQKYTKTSWKIFEFVAGSWFGVCLVGALR